MTARNLFTPRNVHGKPMHLGKNQQYALTAFFDDNGDFRKGVARSAWLYRVLDSLVKHGLATKGLTRIFDGDENVMGTYVPDYALTIFGLQERARLQSTKTRRKIVADIVPSNKTLRQSAHIEENMRATILRGAEAQMRNEGSMESDSSADVEAMAYSRAEMVVMELNLVEGDDALPTRQMLIRWLASVYLAAHYTQRAIVYAKDIR